MHNYVYISLRSKYKDCNFGSKIKRNLIQSVRGNFKSVISVTVVFQSPGDLSDTCELPRYQEILELEMLRNVSDEGNGMEGPAPVLFHHLRPTERLGMLHLKKMY